MNTLTYVIYLIGFINTLQASMISLLIALVLFFTGRAVFVSMSRDDMTRKYNPDRYNEAVMWFKERQWVPTKWMLWTIGIMMAAVVILPSQRTMHLMLASEIGEMAITSEPAQEIYDDIRTIISGYAADARVNQ